MSDVDFWSWEYDGTDNMYTDLKVRHDEGLYPPKRSFLVHSEFKLRRGTVTFEVSGMENEEFYPIRVSKAFGLGEL